MHTVILDDIYTSVSSQFAYIKNRSWTWPKQQTAAERTTE